MTNRTDLMIQVAELYYQQGLRQQDISSMLGISRPKICRLLENARTEGIVEIIVHSPVQKHPRLSRALREEFGLCNAIVTKGEYEFPTALSQCASCAVSFLKTVLSSHMTLGILWGRAMEAFCEVLPDLTDYHVNVVQMVGSLGAGHPHSDGLELAMRISEKLGGTCSNIYAPVYVKNKTVYAYLVAEPQIKASLERAMQVDVILTGIGSLDDPASALFQSGYYTRKDREALQKRGAVASLMGRMIDAKGKEVSLEQLHVIAAPLKAMHAPALSIGMNASAEKAECTLAALRGKYINVLIVDEPLARELLRLAGKPFEETDG